MQRQRSAQCWSRVHLRILKENCPLGRKRGQSVDVSTQILLWQRLPESRVGSGTGEGFSNSYLSLCSEVGACMMNPIYWKGSTHKDFGYLSVVTELIHSRAQIQG